MAATSAASASCWTSRRKARSGCGNTAMSTSRSRRSSPPLRCTTTKEASRPGNAPGLLDFLLAEADAQQADDANHNPGRLDQDGVEAVPQRGPQVALHPIEAGRQELVPDVVQGEAAAHPDRRVVDAGEREQERDGDEGKPG